MSRPHDRRRQLKLQKAKNRRALAKRKLDAQSLPVARSALIERACRAPFGPCWVSVALQDEDPEQRALISVIVTRRLAGQLLPIVALVDRTCLGVKNAFVGRPQSELEIEAWIDNLAERGDPLEKAELLLAQSVIYHAIDYARSLGFEPHRDLVLRLIGDRPAALLDTALARPERPSYVSGPDDDVASIVARLDASVGRGNYDVIDLGAGDLRGFTLVGADLDDDLELEEEDELEEDELDVITVEGTEVVSARGSSTR
ncbi:MAG: hypothetical protein ABI895_21230 [Deltaproteobacteria bacterium]